MPVLAALLLQLTAAAAPLTVRVTEVRDAKGEVRVELCSARRFLHGGCEYTVSVPAQKDVTEVTIADVPAGLWAVQAYHDRNANREVDRGALGLPLEEIGFSRQAPVGLRGPSWSRASFVHDGPETTTVRLRRYW